MPAPERNRRAFEAFRDICSADRRSGASTYDLWKNTIAISKGVDLPRVRVPFLTGGGRGKGELVPETAYIAASIVMPPSITIV